MRKRLTITALKAMKVKKDPITMLTAYDYPSAVLAEEAGIDAILVGDSLGNVVLGYDTTIPVTLEDMIYHTKAVSRGARETFIVTDMPFMTYGVGRESTMRNAARIMQEGGAHALKLEGGSDIADEVAALVKAGIPVMGHIGLTPQSVHQLGGYRVQGKLDREAEKLMEDAKALEKAGVFAIVLELVTEPLAAAISQELSIPTIGIGAGRGCDGQVLVYHDLIQYSSPAIPKKMVKTYASIGDTIRNAIKDYVSDVKTKAFPAEEHSFGVAKTEIQEQVTLYGAAGSLNMPSLQREEQSKRDCVSNHS
ncbi:3-methyl-2-oxobutanoate hydroxymethyltransferase [Paenibacillus sp. NEAU-GSW1]|uniref:3-methyl-2-oxobutanoate hydroxymethyltransferase n=1 Tax=Paenibacillus sp. NEAU-GSW1 TaxID=2682486 RepID=UPI0012E24C0C|nr:3-methyl-2-oxobutanoate hydroxymethyltransferase [Paenibacillus sp. NEAU-GSW1]MUT65447.1 3-methyl-2-oxobutanoate hydroxymethyltransferase [Paenibacillus sp. NEAU-GSW1]